MTRAWHPGPTRHSRCDRTPKRLRWAPGDTDLAGAMMAQLPTLLVTFDAEARLRALVEEAARGKAQIVWLADLSGAARENALRGAGAVIARHTNELKQGEPGMLTSARLLQMTTAGVDY